MEDCIRSDSWVALKLPSGLHKVVQIKFNNSISLGKYGSFNTNELLGRPYYHTYEIIEPASNGERRRLRIVPSSELVAQESVSEAELSSDQLDHEGTDKLGAEFEVVDQDGKVLMRTNQKIFDQIGAQKLTMAEIEGLKKAEAASGRDIIAKILESHSELDKKTAFSLAKYTTRKANKYLRRFVPLPMDVSMIARWWLYEKDPPKILELREETMALALSWSNIHFTQDIQTAFPDASRGRWLVVDETGGLLVAAMAERLGIAQPYRDGQIPSEELQDVAAQDHDGTEEGNHMAQQNHQKPGAAAISSQESHMSATHNTIHMVHANSQPNLALLSFFSYDYANSTPSHPLHKHLKTLSWLQLLHPEDDPMYIEPEIATQDELASWKSNKRGTYYRKRRRWQRTRAVVDEVRAGGFDGLLICSPMAPVSPVRHLVPLLRGGAPLVVYSPIIEPLAQLADFYSTARRTAFLNLSDEEQISALQEGAECDFPVNPTLLVSPSVFTARARSWQVLPGRTHPIMTGPGGAQGYVLTATRVIPIEGERVEARGAFKRRKIGKEQEAHQKEREEDDT